MKSSHILAVLFLLLILPENSKAQLSNLSNTQIISLLSADSLQGRKPGTEGMERATIACEHFFKDVGIRAYFTHGYRDSFQIGSITAYNIVGLLPAQEITDEYIIISAHLDHLGVSSRAGADTIYNGANDNASGVTAVFQIAKRLSKKKTNKNILFVLFSGEESGLLGSQHMAEWVMAQKINLRYVINIEMIGYPFAPAPDKVYITGFDYSNMGSLLNQVLGQEFFVPFHKGESYQLFKFSDNFPFYSLLHIPAHTFSTFDLESYAYYHQLGDEVAALDLNHLDRTISLLGEAIEKLLEIATEPRLKD